MNPGRSSYYGDPVSFVASSPALENESLPTSHLCEENAVTYLSHIIFSHPVIVTAFPLFAYSNFHTLPCFSTHVIGSRGESSGA